MPPAITVTGISKSYSLSHFQKYLSLREAVFDWLRPGPQETFWALKDITFSVAPGEVVGIIGGNGAGKTTLLKILSRVTLPTSGRAVLRGRVASLLGVGTGFHQELTGRENIYLSGTILGMTHREIKRKFEAIVDFAGTEKFLDTQVKHYSSGMYMRLAFSVAAHLNSEILIVDEVLAVGDSQFREKSVQKMSDAASAGRTVILVSHNMGLIKQLCNTVILLDSGKITQIGKPGKVVDYYLNRVFAPPSTRKIISLINQLPANSDFHLSAVRLVQNAAEVTDVVQNGSPLTIEIDYEITKKLYDFRLYFDICDSEDELLFRSILNGPDNQGTDSFPGKYTSTAVISKDVFGSQRYKLVINAGIRNVRNYLPSPGLVIGFAVENTGNYNLVHPDDPINGKLALVLPWQTLSR